jgi:hypothetical protein
LKVGKPKVSSPQVGAPKVGPHKVGFRKVGIPKVGSPQEGALKVGSRKLGLEAGVYIPPPIPVVYSRFQHVNVPVGADAPHIYREQQWKGHYPFEFESTHTLPLFLWVSLYERYEVR